jgi:hypothetical protein
MRLLLACLIVLSAVSVARAESPIPMKERLKWEMWHEGVQELAKRPKPTPPAERLPEEITRILNKFQL